jgi:hypothetical protein
MKNNLVDDPFEDVMDKDGIAGDGKISPDLIIGHSHAPSPADRLLYLVSNHSGFLPTTDQWNEVQKLAKEMCQALSAADSYIGLLEELVAEYGAPLPYEKLMELHANYTIRNPAHACGVKVSQPPK